MYVYVLYILQQQTSHITGTGVHHQEKASSSGAMGNYVSSHENARPKTLTSQNTYKSASDSKGSNQYLANHQSGVDSQNQIEVNNGRGSGVIRIRDIMDATVTQQMLQSSKNQAVVSLEGQMQSRSGHYQQYDNQGHMSLSTSNSPFQQLQSNQPGSYATHAYSTHDANRPGHQSASGYGTSNQVNLASIQTGSIYSVTGTAHSGEHPVLKSIPSSQNTEFQNLQMRQNQETPTRLPSMQIRPKLAEANSGSYQHTALNLSTQSNPQQPNLLVTTHSEQTLTRPGLPGGVGGVKGKDATTERSTDLTFNLYGYRPFQPSAPVVTSQVYNHNESKMSSQQTAENSEVKARMDFITLYNHKQNQLHNSASPTQMSSAKDQTVCAVNTELSQPGLHTSIKEGLGHRLAEGVEERFGQNVVCEAKSNHVIAEKRTCDTQQNVYSKKMRIDYQNLMQDLESAAIPPQSQATRQDYMDTFMSFVSVNDSVTADRVSTSQDVFDKQYLAKFQSFVEKPITEQRSTGLPTVQDEDVTLKPAEIKLTRVSIAKSIKNQPVGNSVISDSAVVYEEGDVRRCFVDCSYISPAKSNSQSGSTAGKTEENIVRLDYSGKLETKRKFKKRVPSFHLQVQTSTTSSDSETDSRESRPPRKKKTSKLDFLRKFRPSDDGPPVKGDDDIDMDASAEEENDEKPKTILKDSSKGCDERSDQNTTGVATANSKMNILPSEMCTVKTEDLSCDQPGNPGNGKNVKQEMDYHDSQTRNGSLVAVKSCERLAEETVNVKQEPSEKTGCTEENVAGSSLKKCSEDGKDIKESKDGM